MFEEMVDTQARLGEEPRFTEAVKGTVNFGRGSGTDDTGLWGCVVLWQILGPVRRAGSGTALTPHTLPCVCVQVLWQQFLEQRSNVVGNKMQREVRAEARDG